MNSQPTEPSPEELVAKAKEQADQILEAAQQEAQELAGHTDAVVRREQSAIFGTASRELLAGLEAQWQMALQRLELETAGLVAEIVHRVLAERFEADPQAIVPVVREALKEVADSARMRVLVAPRHEAALTEAYRDLSAVLTDETRLEIVVDETAAPNGCVIHSDQGSVDARLEGRLEAIQRVVEDTLSGHQAA